MGPKKASGWVNYEVLGIWGSEDWEVGTVVGRCGQSGEIPRPAFRSCPRPCSTNLGPYNFENLGLKFLKTDWRFLRKTIDPEGFLVIQLIIHSPTDVYWLPTVCWALSRHCTYSNEQNRQNFLYLEVYILVLITVLGSMREIPNYS